MATTTHHSTSATDQAELDALLAELLPRQGQWSAEGYLWLTDRTNRPIEFVGGQIEVLPMPTHQHQAILKFLFLVLHTYLHPRGGTAVFAPLRVQVGPGMYREPDLVALLDAGDPRLQNRYWLGADLVLEVVSPDDPDRDIVDKRRDYAAAGIREYWIVDPRVETVTVLRLAGGVYVEHGVFGRGAQAASALLEGFTVGVADVFDAR